MSHVWKKDRQSVLFVTHEIDKALTVASRIAVLSSRPTSILEVIDLPNAEGRDASDSDLNPIRQHIIHEITQQS